MATITTQPIRTSGDTNVARLNAAGTAVVGADGNEISGLTETSPGSGIYLAEVANKVDTYANLKAYAGADGQISAASDKDVLFRHNGTANQAEAYYKSTHVLKSYLGAVGTTTSTVLATWTPLVLDDEAVAQVVWGNSAIWTAGAATEIVLPTITTGVYIIQVSGLFLFTANATGTIRRLRIESWDGAAWANADMTGAAFNISTDAANSATDPVAKYVTLSGIGLSGQNRFRIAASQSSGSALVCSVQGVMVIDAFHKD